MTDRELMQQALEQLDRVAGAMPFPVSTQIRAALRERLARQEQEPQHTNKYVTQEPVAWRTFDGEGGYDYRDYEMNENYGKEWAERNPNHAHWVDPLYTDPPDREWQGLTDEEVALLEWAVSTLSDFSASDRSRPAWQFVYMPKLADLRNMAEQHKAKLREKNV